MDANQFDEDQILEHLGYRPRYIINSVIDEPDRSSKPSFVGIERNPRSNSNPFTKLPLELLHTIFVTLDLKTIAGLCLASLACKIAVESSPVYQRLVAHMGHLFGVLNKARVLSLHSLQSLDIMLKSDRCVTCCHYGAFLFILSCERCCIACLEFNASWRLIPQSLAQRCFILDKQQTKLLPKLRSIPGRYSVTWHTSRQKAMWLTSVYAAKSLAMKFYGSIQAVEDIGQAVPLEPRGQYAHRTLLDASMHRPTGDPMLMKLNRNDWYSGLGCVAVPSLLAGSLEQGIWCRGCERTQGLRRFHYLDATEYGQHGLYDGDHLSNLSKRAWSRSEFLQHATCCISATVVIAQQWTGLS